MPWTLAHPAAVLPLRRWSHRLPFPGLVIGSMSPDFVYYTGHFDLARQAHSPLGLFTICLPAGLLLALVLRWLRQPVIGLLPQPHRAALSSLPASGGLPAVRELVALALALVIGAATHVLWDSFTHRNGFAVQQLPFLQQLLFRVGQREFHIFNSLQHTSTVLGSLCLVVAYMRWLRKTPGAPGFRPDAHDPARYKVLLVCLLASIALAVPMAIARIGQVPGPLSLSLVAISGLIYATSIAAVLVAAAAILWSRWRAGAGADA